MIVGFTGTQHGMTDEQKEQVRSLLTNHYDYWVDNYFHHGVCIGADEEAHSIAIMMGWKIHFHPPTDESKSFKFEMRIKDVVTPPADYLVRNRDIVDSCQLLIACPRNSKYNLRSGTWWTLNYAIKWKRSRITVYPDGSLYVRFHP